MKEPTSHIAKDLTVEKAAVWPIVLGVFALCCLIGWSNAPDVNEAHYLGKALHYWNPEWCADDFFLNSSDAHLVFYWVFGWVPSLIGLEAAATVGRLIAWLLLSFSWLGLCRSLGVNGLRVVAGAAVWFGLVRWCHLSGEWILGGIEAKGFSLPFVFWGIAELVKQHWGRSYALLGIATSLHVLVGGWAFLMAGMAHLVIEKKDAVTLPNIKFVLLGVCLALPGLIPALVLNSTVSSEYMTAANEIYVYKRLPHHLVLNGFSSTRIGFGVALLSTWLGIFIWRNGLRQQGDHWKRWDYFVFGSVVIAALGFVLSSALAASESGAGLLRFYWFRSFDVFVPALIATTLSFSRRCAINWQCLILVSLCVGMGSEQWDRWRDGRSLAAQQSMPRSLRKDPDHRRQVTYRIWKDWVRACRWIKEHTPEDAIVLTPRRQQTFKWHAHRAEVVNWKDIPQDALGLLEWNNRIDAVYTQEVLHNGFEGSSEHVHELSQQYKFDYVIAAHFIPSRHLGWKRVYPTPDESGRVRASMYVVYEVGSVKTQEAGNSGAK